MTTEGELYQYIDRELNLNGELYPLSLGEDPVFPAIIYQVIDQPLAGMHRDGASLTYGRRQFTVFAEHRVDAWELADALGVALKLIGITVVNKLDGERIGDYAFSVVVDAMVWR